MDVPLWLLVASVLLWAAAFLVRAVRIEQSPLSHFELKRRADQGDPDAQRREEREAILPRAITVQRMIEALLLVLATALTVFVFGWLLGVLLSSLLSLFAGSISRAPFVMRAAHALYDPREASLLDRIGAWQWLDAFRGAVTQSHEPVAASKEELAHIIERSAAVLSPDEQVRFRASLSFGAHTVQDIMTPVSVVEMADVRDSLGPLVLDDLHKTGHSRFPVIDGDIHHIVGILYLHDIINLKTTKPTVREAMDGRVHYIHEHQSLEHALHGFLRTHRHLFIVVNDYRETVGVLSLEDVLETLLGKKIIDEFDRFEDLRAVAESNPRKNNTPKGKTDI